MASTLRSEAIGARYLTLAAGTVLALGLAACGEPPSTLPGASDMRSWIEVPATAAIGSLEGEDEYLFGDVRSVAVSDGGVVYVGDRIGATVRAYTHDGVFLGDVAREGQGPGEIYGWPADLSLGPDGKLYVRDAGRVTVFAPSERSVADSLVATWPSSLGNLTYSRSRVASDGRYYYPNGASSPTGVPTVFYRVLRDGVDSGDTLEVPYQPGLEGTRRAFYRTGPSGGRMVEGLSRVPFAPAPSWSVTPDGTVLVTSGRDHWLHELAAGGDTVRSFTVERWPDRAIPGPERADSMRALQSRIDSLPVPVEDVVNLGAGVAELTLPETFPPVRGVYVASSGQIWVERWHPTSAQSARFYTVLDSLGRHVGDVSLQAPLLTEPTPYFSGRYVVGVVQDEATDVHRVVTFALPSALAR